MPAQLATVEPSTPRSSSSQSPLVGIKDIEGMASLALFEMATTFLVEPPKQARSLASASSLQFLVIKGPMRGASWMLRLQLR